MIKKAMVIGVIILFVVGYVIYEQRIKQQDAVMIPSVVTPTSAPSTASSPINGRYKDGTYNGPVTDAFYGNIQVAVVISGGKITDVQFLQFPNDTAHSVEVSNQSLPQLKQEAITAQSAQVDIVSGATQTSQAFMQSLQSALQQAKS